MDQNDILISGLKIVKTLLVLQSMTFPFKKFFFFKNYWIRLLPNCFPIIFVEWVFERYPLFFFRFLTIIYQNITLCELGGAKMYIEIKWFSSLLFLIIKSVWELNRKMIIQLHIVISEKRSKKEKNFHFISSRKSQWSVTSTSCICLLRKFL